MHLTEMCVDTILNLSTGIWTGMLAYAIVTMSRNC